MMHLAQVVKYVSSVCLFFSSRCRVKNADLVFEAARYCVSYAVDRNHRLHLLSHPFAPCTNTSFSAEIAACSGIYGADVRSIGSHR